jgi:hypothetical protein
MTSASLQTFYATAAGVAGALIGLLFVAVSVAHDQTRDDLRPSHRIRAGAALTTFTNTLLVSLFALIERGQVATPSAACAVAGELFVLAAFLSIAGGGDQHPQDFVILGLLAVTFTAQLITGIANMNDPAAPAVQQTIAIIIVGCFVIGIHRSWGLIGGQRTAPELKPRLPRRRRRAVNDPSALQAAATGSPASSSTSLGSRSATHATVEVIWRPSAAAQRSTRMMK